MSQVVALLVRATEVMKHGYVDEVITTFDGCLTESYVYARETVDKIVLQLLGLEQADFNYHVWDTEDRVAGQRISVGVFGKLTVTAPDGKQTVFNEEQLVAILEAKLTPEMACRDLLGVKK